MLAGKCPSLHSHMLRHPALEPGNIEGPPSLFYSLVDGKLGLSGVKILRIIPVPKSIIAPWLPPECPGKKASDHALIPSQKHYQHP